MRRLAFAGLLVFAPPARAHRLDEYLQLTALSIERGHVRAKMFLTPGVAVAKRVIGLMDANGDGSLSPNEQRLYAQRVLRDLVLSVDGHRLPPRLVTFRFPKVAEMKQGIGEIDLEFEAPFSGGAGNHRLVFENRHQKAIAAYLVECYTPEDPGLRVTGQSRSTEQSRYAMSYVQAVGRAAARSIPIRPRMG